MMFKIKFNPPVSPFKPLETAVKFGAYVGSPIRATDGDFTTGKFETTPHAKQKFWVFAALIYLLNAIVIYYWYVVGHNYLTTFTYITKFGMSLR